MSPEQELPHTYRDALQTLYDTDLTGIHRTKGTHAGLWLDKYIKDQDQTKANNRSNLIQAVAKIPIPEAYIQFYQQWEQTLTNYGVPDKYKRLAKAKGRLIVGLGDESVLETSIALHHTYGVPYIPGSALKGLAASYAHQQLGATWHKGTDEYNIIFGNMKQAGYITFFDALYKPNTGHNGQALYPDIITVHHPKYYQGDTPEATPSDWDSPTPIPFLSVTGEYLVALAAPDLEDAQPWIDRTFEILKLALKDMGIGAKTSSGYGRMTLEPLPIDPEVRAIEKFRQEIAVTPSIAGRTDDFYRRWQQLKSDKARAVIARAIIEKVQQAGREKASAEKSWYKELKAFIVDNNV